MKTILSVVAIVSCFSFGLAQKSFLNAKSIEAYKESRQEAIDASENRDSIRIQESIPLEYNYVEPKDVVWSKVTWEIIDFNHRLNQPYYHTSPGTITQRKSLFNALIEGIRSYQIVEVYDDEYFEVQLTHDEIKSRLERIDTSDYGFEQLRAGEELTEDAIDTYQTTSDQIKMMKVKGMWYIDRRLGEMKYRLYGICIMGPDVQTQGTQYDDGVYADLFWIYYPDARNFLSNFKVFNPSNSSTTVTYDDILNARRFASVIYKAETSYGEKPIEDYIPKDAKGQLEEHHRIRESILEAEADMWNY